MSNLCFPYVIFIVTLLTVVTSNRIFDPPKLEILSNGKTGQLNGERIADIQTGTALHLKCVGSQQIFWIHPEDVQITTDNIPNEMTKCEEENGQNTCESHLIINETYFEQTGLYTCHYKDSLTFENSDTIYVFVNDMNNIVVPVSELSSIEIIVKQLVSLNIPCIPTNSRTKVSLWKVMSFTDSNAAIALKEEEVQADPMEGISYDPITGFTIRRPYWDRSYGQLLCKFQYENVTAEVKVISLWNPLINPQQDVKIESKSTDRVFIGGKFWLTCEVLAPEGVGMTIEWTTPALNTSFAEMSTVEKEDFTVRNISVSKFSRRLTIAKVANEAEGWYYCTVKDSNGQEYKHSKYVTVYEKSLKPFIKISTDLDTKVPISREEGEELKLVFYIASSPKVVKFEDITWFKDGVKLDSTSRFKSELIENEALLEVKNLTTQDSGLYSLHVASDNKDSNKLSVEVMVMGPPMVSMKNSGLQKVANGSKFEVQCRAFGYPRPALRITFRECLEESCKNSTAQLIPVWDTEHLGQLLNEEKVILANHSNSVELTLEGKAKKSGTYSCVADNGRGHQWADYLLTVVPANDKGSGSSTTQISLLSTLASLFIILYII